jgi:hypothetical protein
MGRFKYIEPAKNNNWSQINNKECNNHKQTIKL